MKNCVFTELSVVSFQERAARRITLNRQTNVFIGANDTGKSSLLKCMYWAFGAEPSVTHPRWERAEVAVMLRFEIEGEPYQILRQRDQFVLLDRSDKIIARERRITTGIGPRIAELFDFGLVATDRLGEEFIPPPAFLFLPFYIDQEASWKSNWSGFRKLEQVRGYRKTVAEYHLGIRPNSYYKAKSELDRSQIELKRLVTAREVVLEAKRSADEHLPYQGFDIDPEAFAQDIDELLQAVNELATKERSYQASIQELRAERHTINLQTKVVQNELGHVKADYGYVSDAKHLGPVECPTCGAFHENSFLDRFERSM
jgi:DNA repair exonuclease SbcCD ATPase subunit